MASYTFKFLEMVKVNTRSSRVGFDALLLKTRVTVERPVVASHSSMDHASFGSCLASHSQVADMGKHCPEGTHSAIARRAMFIVDRVAYRPKHHCLVGPFLSITALCGVHSSNGVLLSESAVFFYTSPYFFRIRFWTFSTCSHTFACLN